MDHHTGRAFARLGRRRLIKAGVQKTPRRAGRKPERMSLVRLLDNGPVIRQGWHLLPSAHEPCIADRRGRPVRLLEGLSIRMRAAIAIKWRTEKRPEVAPPHALQG